MQKQKNIQSNFRKLNLSKLYKTRAIKLAYFYINLIDVFYYII